MLLKNTEKWALFFLFSGHLLAAYYSYGYHHPDEHFQIWEWANYWLGLSSDAKALPWEYGAQIRPWFQPFIHIFFMKIFLMLNIFNPFSTAFFMRAFYGVLNVWALWCLWKVVKEKYGLSTQWFLWIALLWFFPYIHVRTSSENLAGIFLTFAFTYFLRTQKYFWTGILFGFAFLARYQIALGLVGLALAMIWKERKIIFNHWKLLGGFVIPVLFGTVLDRIGYGNWVCAPYRYFTVNLVQGVAATYNPYPWYMYFNWILQLNPFVSLPLFFGVIAYWKKEKIEPLGAFVFSFFFLHHFIENKEYRFLFPVLNLVPFMMAVGFQSYEERLKRKAWFIAYFAMSVLAFCVSAMRGAAYQRFWPIHSAARYGEPGDTWLSNRPYQDLGALAYYHIPDHHLLLFNTVPDFGTLVQTYPNAKVLIDGTQNDPFIIQMQADLARRGCKSFDSGLPLWLYATSKWIPFTGRLPFQAAYQCQPTLHQ